jgi:hypothetical protein
MIRRNCNGGDWPGFNGWSTVSHELGNVSESKPTFGSRTNNHLQVLVVVKH